MGIAAERAHGALRLTAGRGTTADDVDRAAKAMRDAVGRMRQLGVAPTNPVASA
jgi:cysteine sulfinate desulfinase/cysteine desulfurase-like protein